MSIFRDKGIFLWCYWDISFDPVVVADWAVDGGFESVYVHVFDGANEASYARLENGRYVDHVNCTDELVAELRSRGLTIYGWGAPYGRNLAGEIAMMISQTKRYSLDGLVIDAEVTWDAHANAVADTRTIITSYQAQCPGVPVAWCWWPLFESSTGVPWHPVAILREAMKFADAGMPMAYWEGSTAALAVAYLNRAWSLWTRETAKPIIPAGRAWTGDGGEATRDAVLAFDARARALGAAGITWWDFQHAVKLPACWQALKETKPFTQTEEPKPMTDWTKNPIGLYTKTASWTNAAFDFIIGHAGESWNDPNPNLKPIEERAATYNQVFGALWDFDVDFYSYNQYLADEAHWPPEANDQPLQKAIRALTSRAPKFVVVRLNTYLNYQTGKAEDPGYISYAAQVFCGRLSDWLARNKPGCKLVLATSHDWITAHAPNVNNWGYRYATMISQAAVNPLVANAYPQETDKVKNYISIRETNEFWWYYDTATVDLILFYLGDRAKFAQWLGEAVQVPDTTPPSAPGNLVAAVSDGIVALYWSPSTGEPVGYQVYQAGAEVMSAVGTSAQLPGIYGPGVYSFGVSAYDAAGNESAEAMVEVTIIGPAEPEITRAEFGALTARVAELERWRRS